MKKAIFLDRDGTLNEDIGYAKSIADINLFPETAEALREFKKLGYVLIVITNQAVIARGWLSEAGMESLHAQYNELLIQRGGAPVDYFYFCPHHPNADVPAYRAVCTCRKPAPGLILQAARERDITLEESWMIGDKPTDIAAGKQAGCKTVLIETPKSYETMVNSDNCIIYLSRIPVMDNSRSSDTIKRIIHNVSGVALDKNTKADYEVKNLMEAAEIVRRGSA